MFILLTYTLLIKIKDLGLYYRHFNLLNSNFMYIGRTSPACLKPDRINQPRRKSTLNLDQVLNDIEACLKYLE